MSFTTKINAQKWAIFHLKKSPKGKGKFIDPINGGEVEVIRRGKYWGFIHGESWVFKVEELRETKPNLQPDAEAWVTPEDIKNHIKSFGAPKGHSFFLEKKKRFPILKPKGKKRLSLKTCWIWIWMMYLSGFWKMLISLLCNQSQLRLTHQKILRLRVRKFCAGMAVNG